ncbi:MAG: hypothetical protein HAW62_02530 [Endozoicomonadaceae bacterium]|nr:hypothetical protein [Endozoicomonadaceae bacterium]
MYTSKPTLPTIIYYDPLNPKKNRLKTFKHRFTHFFLKKKLTSTIQSKRQPCLKKQQKVVKPEWATQAILAAYPIHHSLQMIHDSDLDPSLSIHQDHWYIDTQYLKKLSHHQPFFKYYPKTQALYHQASGLVAFLFCCSRTNTLFFVLGYAHWGHQSIVQKYQKKSFKSSIQRLLPILQADFDAAQILISTLITTLNKGQIKQLTLLGLAQSGALITYASLFQKTPINTVVFASSPLPKKQIKRLPKQQVINAEKTITQIKIKGDLFPYCHPFSEHTGRYLGQTIMIYPAHRYTLRRHKNIYKHLRYASENTCFFSKL